MKKIKNEIQFKQKLEQKLLHMVINLRIKQNNLDIKMELLIKKQTNYLKKIFKKKKFKQKKFLIKNMEVVNLIN